MQKIYRIEEGKRSRYAFRKAGALAIYLLIGLVIIFALVLTQVKDASDFWREVEWQWVPLVFGAVFGIRYFQELNIAQALAFEIGDTYLGRYLEKGNLNAANQYAVQRDQRRYGAQANQRFAIEQISRVEVSKKSIKLYTKDYQFMNGNGRIVIPAEVEGFEQLKLRITQL